MNLEITELEKIKSKHGYLVEFLKEDELEEDQKKFAQIYVATILPGGVRGNHFHTKKLEWFTILNGKVRVLLEDVRTKKRKDLILDSSEAFLKRILIKNETAHVFKNISDSTVVLVVYSNKIYDPKNPDTYDYKML